MNVRRINLILWSLTALFAGGTVVSVLIGVLVRVDVPSREPAGALVSATEGTVPDVQTTAALAGIATVFEMFPRPPVNVTFVGGPACASADMESVVESAAATIKRAA